MATFIAILIVMSRLALEPQASLPINFKQGIYYRNKCGFCKKKSKLRTVLTASSPNYRMITAQPIKSQPNRTNKQLSQLLKTPNMMYLLYKAADYFQIINVIMCGKKKSDVLLFTTGPLCVHLVEPLLMGGRVDFKPMDQKETGINDAACQGTGFLSSQ